MNKHDEFTRENDLAADSFSKAYKLLLSGDKAAAKKIEAEGDRALKRARQLFKEMKSGKA